MLSFSEELFEVNPQAAPTAAAAPVKAAASRVRSVYA